MKLVQINSVCGAGSTGKICVGISEVLNSRGIENYILYGQGESYYPQAIKCSQPFGKLQSLLSRVLGNYGFNSRETTQRLIKELDRIRPDVVQLHNLHSHNCHLELLMNYLKRKKIKVFWTFHDCWAFTAYCPHFVMAGCDQWKTGCEKCVQFRTFSWFRDNCKRLYHRKRLAVEGMDLTVITPSQWLAAQVKESFFKQYSVNVINNGIDINVFRPCVSNFKKKHSIPENKAVLLGVAIKWVPRKGVDVFSRLAEQLDPDQYQIVLVGTDDNIDKELPKNIISIHRTANQQELAEIYTAADLFVNPTREEVFGLVNVEALACGTPVLTYRTGGSPECIDETCGSVVGCDDFEALRNEIIRICTEKPYTSEACQSRARRFDQAMKYHEYVDLYLKNAFRA